jgi:hypothetical protein
LLEVTNVMIIVYGTRSHTSDTALAIPCGNCQRPALVQSDWHRYFHIMFIPTFPVEKHRVVHCGACDNSYETKASTPIWTFLGSVLLAACVVVGVGRQALRHLGASATSATITSAASAPPATPSSAPAASAPAPPRALPARPAAPGAASHPAPATSHGAVPTTSASAARRKK